jgi:hypothetical protein
VQTFNTAPSLSVSNAFISYHAGLLIWNLFEPEFEKVGDETKKGFYICIDFNQKFG